ncbi:MAG: GldG family protein [Candidatus Ozemobacteraceae bacterium]
MLNKRTESGFFPTALLLLGVITMLFSGVFFAMFPSRTPISIGILIAGAVLCVIAFICRPRLLSDIATSRRTALWINDALLVLLIIGIGIMLSIIGARRHVRYDMTRDGLYSISDSTTKVLNGLVKDVKITAFFAKGDPAGAMIEDLMREYRRYTDRVKFTVVDPYRDPLTTKAMNITAPGTVVMQCDENRKDVMPDELFQQSLRPMPGERPKFQGEQALTSGIVNVTAGKKRKVLFVTGHDEPRITAYNPQGLAGMQQFLVKENYEVGEVNLLEKGASEASVLIIMSPKKPFHPKEIEILQQFVKERKGGLLMALDPDNKLEGLDAFLVDNYGIVANQQIVLDPRAVFDDASNIIPTMQQHAIMKAQIEKKSAVLMSVVRGLSFEKKESLQTTAILQSDAGSFGKNMSDIVGGKVEFNPQRDIHGPLTVGITLENTGAASGSRAVIFGDADFASNKLLQVQGNADLIVNSINWLAGQEQMISIRPKSFDFATVTLDKEAANRVFIMTTFVSPLLVILFGGAVWYWRRRV